MRLLGSMQACWAGDRSFLPSNKKTRAVLAVLALAGEKPVKRDLLIGLLWQMRGWEQAQASLRQSVHELRRCLAPIKGANLQSTGNGLTLRIEHLWIDSLFVQTEDFQSQHVVDVLRGPLLADLAGLSETFDEWIFAERDKLSEKIRLKLDLFLENSSIKSKTLNMAEAMIAFDATHEAPWKALADSHSVTEDPASAINIYHRCLNEARTRDGRPAFDTTTVLAHCLPSPGMSGEAPEHFCETATLASPLGRFRRDNQLAFPCRSARVAVVPTRTFGGTAEELALCIDWQLQAALHKFEYLSCAPVSPAGAKAGFARNLVEEGFDFLLEGVLDRTAGQNNVSVRLRDLHMRGEIFWSQRICQPSSGTGLLEADFAGLLAPQIAAEISKYQALFLETSLTTEVDLSRLVLRAARSVQRLDRHSLWEADTLLAEAIKQHDREPALLAWSAYVQLLRLGQGYLSEVVSTQRRMGELIDKGLSLTPDGATVLSIAGHVLAFTQNRLDEGLSLQELALSKNPNLPMAWLFSGLAHTYAGEHKEAIRRFECAKQLSPADPQAYFVDTGLSLSHLLNGDTESALSASKNAIRLNPNFSSSFKVAVSASGYTDRGGNDDRLLKRLLAIDPALTVERALSRTPLTRRADQTRLADGLRMAGMPK